MGRLAARRAAAPLRRDGAGSGRCTCSKRFVDLCGCCESFMCVGGSTDPRVRTYRHTYTRPSTPHHLLTPTNHPTPQTPNRQQLFGSVRDEWLAEDPDDWIEANPLYAGADFSLGCGNWDAYILTTKQTRFVETLLAARGAWRVSRVCVACVMCIVWGCTVDSEAGKTTTTPSPTIPAHTQLTPRTFKTPTTPQNPKQTQASPSPATRSSGSAPAPRRTCSPASPASRGSGPARTRRRSGSRCCILLKTGLRRSSAFVPTRGSRSVRCII